MERLDKQVLDWYAGLRDPYVNRIADGSDESLESAADALIDAVWKASRCTDKATRDRAKTLIHHFGKQSIRKDVREQVRWTSQQRVTDSEGRTLKIPGAYMITGADGGYQPSFWMTAPNPRATVEQIVARLRARRDGLAAHIRHFELVILPILDRYPDAESAEEAIRADGKDPEELDIDIAI